MQISLETRVALLALIENCFRIVTIFPEAFLTAIDMLSLCTSMPIYLLLVIEGAPFWMVCGLHQKPYSRKGAPFYIAYCRRSTNCASDCGN
jgi:hypothetical protein